jgi:hypothetical protein
MRLSLKKSNEDRLAKAKVKSWLAAIPSAPISGTVLSEDRERLERHRRRRVAKWEQIICGLECLIKLES